jgi:hypothetical protein
LREDWGTDFAQLWREKVGIAPCPGFALRYNLVDRWVRFHSLPNAKRYAENDQEEAEILARHLETLSFLSHGQPNNLWLISTVWSDDVTPNPHLEPHVELEMFGESIRWATYQHDDPVDEVASEALVGLYVQRVTDVSLLDGLLRFIAEDTGPDITITASDLRWLYHPYDGGADVFAPSHDLMNAISGVELLRAWKPEWLSDRDDGL